MKILAESLQEFKQLKKLEEGVGDKYAAKFGVRDEEEEFEKQYQQQRSKKKGEVVANVFGKPIIKNPSDLSSFPAGARGVITKDGNLYLASDVEDTIHVDILRELAKKGIINKSSVTGWEDPVDIDKHGFVTIQRVWNKPIFAVGESYMIPKPRHEEERKKALDLFKPYFEAAKKKNSNIKFVYNTPRTAAKKSLKPEEYEKFRMQGS